MDRSAAASAARAPHWRLDELAQRVALALAGQPGRSGVSREREAPDQRVIRWYASIGLMDRPIGGRGRGARYGVRHLRQLVAIRRMQGEGLTLAAIQARLAGADDAALAAWAALPVAALGPLPEQPPPTAPAGPARLAPAGPKAVARPQVRLREARSDTRFWSPAGHPPVEVDGVPAHHAGELGAPGATGPGPTGPGASSADGPPGVARAAGPPGGPDPAPPHPASVRLLGGVQLAEGVVLVLPRHPSSTDLAVLAEAAVPLLAALTALGLVPDPTAGAAR
jgi:DNA-binding transcriptional MerR regulator